MNKRRGSRIAMAISLVILIVWAIMGTGTSLAWFADEDDVVNVINFAEFDVEAEYRMENGNWETIDAATTIFDPNALYEPGYVQVVYLRVTNKGTVPFDFQTAVTVTDYTLALNVFGQKFPLQKYLTFGLTPTVATETEMDALVADRDQARAYALEELSNYSSEVAELKAGETVYMALVVQMPKEVGNVANYRGDTIPRVELGLIVTATQQHD